MTYFPLRAGRGSRRAEAALNPSARLEEAGKRAAVIDRRVQRERNRSAPAASKLKTGWSGEEKLHCQDSCNLAWPSHAQSRLLWPFPLFPKSTYFLLKHSHANQSLGLRARRFTRHARFVSNYLRFGKCSGPSGNWQAREDVDRKSSRFEAKLILYTEVVKNKNSTRDPEEKMFVWSKSR